MINNVGRHVVLVLDEVQYLRYSIIGLRPLLAYAYDHLRNMTMVLTGSEVGLLHDFLGLMTHHRSFMVGITTQ